VATSVARCPSSWWRGRPIRILVISHKPFAAQGFGLWISLGQHETCYRQLFKSRSRLRPRFKRCSALGIGAGDSHQRLLAVNTLQTWVFPRRHNMTLHDDTATNNKKDLLANNNTGALQQQQQQQQQQARVNRSTTTVTTLANATDCPAQQSTLDLTALGPIANLLNLSPNSTDTDRHQLPQEVPQQQQQLQLQQRWSQGRTSLCFTSSIWTMSGRYAVYLDGWGQDPAGCGCVATAATSRSGGATTGAPGCCSPFGSPARGTPSASSTPCGRPRRPIRRRRGCAVSMRATR
jgi:hypothetical protein